MDRRTIEYYEQNAKKVANRYEEVESPFSSLFPLIFQRGHRVLDIGSGSGRDMALLAEMGIDAWGLDASLELSRQAIRVHPELEGKIECGFLPRSIPLKFDGSFDGVLLSAVLMHIPDSDLFDAAIRIRQLLKTNGTLLISIPLSRDDMSNEKDRDIKGRLMVVRPASKVQLLFERIGFENVHKWHTKDACEGRDIDWITLQFKYNGTAQTRSIDRIESIINRDTKFATYKLALLRSLCDIAQYESGVAEWLTDGSVGVPINAIAERWIEYYWPIVESKVFIPQSGADKPDSAKPITFRKSLNELISFYRAAGGLAGFTADRSAGSLQAFSLGPYNGALSKVKAAIKQPVRYAGSNALTKPFYFEKSGQLVVMDGDVWRQFVLLGHLIHDSILLRWAEETHRMSKGDIKVSEVFDLLLASTLPARDVADAKEIYSSFGTLECVWSGKSIRKFDVDHAIPFSLWRDNSLWNLLPAAPSINNSKSDKLPEIGLVTKRKDQIILYWESAFSSREAKFRRDTLKIVGKYSLNWKNWQLPLFSSFLEAVETTAVRRGAERWAV